MSSLFVAVLMRYRVDYKVVKVVAPSDVGNMVMIMEIVESPTKEGALLEV